MGCFLGCFGGSKEGKRRSNTHHVVSSTNPNVGHQYQYQPVRPAVAAKMETPDKSQFRVKPEEKQPNEPIQPFIAAKVETPDKPLYVAPESQFRVKPEEKQLSSSIKQSKAEEKQLSSVSHKKVTFDTNVREYEHISANEAPEIIQESDEKEVEKKTTHEASILPSKSLSVSDGGSTLSSLGSFPPNHRYQNCRESDDEEELECQLSDVDKDEDLLDEDDDQEYSDDDDDDDDSRDILELSAGSCSSMESRTRPSTTLATPDSETKTPEFSRGAARDRAGYVHSVLNPVENTTQWKVVKARGTPSPLKYHQKENNVPTHFSRPKSNYEQEVAVDASLANWLGSSEKTPPPKKATIGLEPIASGGGGASASSHGSNSVKSRDQTPPMEQDSGSESSFKGIPNTTSKYREDKSVTWHSTPFETRLDRALNKGVGPGRGLC